MSWGECPILLQVFAIKDLQQVGGFAKAEWIDWHMFCPFYREKKESMKPLRKILYSAVLAGALATASNASAVAINILGGGDFWAQNIQSVTGVTGLGDENVFNWLAAQAQTYGYPAPSLPQSSYTGGPISAGSYLVLHYGAGRGGNQAGGLVPLYFDADEASFSVPATGSGPNGFGGISFVRLYGSSDGETVPDGGSAAMLLGTGLAGLAFLRRALMKL